MHSLEPIFKNRAARFWSSTVFRGMGLYFLRSFSLTLQNQQGEPSNHTRRQWEGRDWTASTERRSRIGRKGGSEAKWRKSDLDIIKRKKVYCSFVVLFWPWQGLPPAWRQQESWGRVSRRVRTQNSTNMKSNTQKYFDFNVSFSHKAEGRELTGTVRDHRIVVGAGKLFSWGVLCRDNMLLTIKSEIVWMHNQCEDQSRNERRRLGNRAEKGQWGCSTHGKCLVEW